jgi:hypothetical protein
VDVDFNFDLKESALLVNIKNVRKKENMPDVIRIHMKESTEYLGKVLALLRDPAVEIC